MGFAMGSCLSVCIDAVRAAGETCRKIQMQLVSEDTLVKEDRSPVTVADFASQAKICGMLRRHFPDHRVHAVNFPGDPYPIHIDATFTPLRPGLILNNPQRRLPDEQRRMFLEKHLSHITSEVRKGHPLKGYFYWSLFDNFEWAHGYRQRFGQDVRRVGG